MKGHRLVVTFDDLDDLVRFAHLVAPVGIGVYRADALDPEYGGKPGKGAYVLRSINGEHGKPDEFRID